MLGPVQRASVKSPVARNRDGRGPVVIANHLVPSLLHLLLQPARHCTHYPRGFTVAVFRCYRIGMEFEMCQIFL
jgi:hypothetical protein